MKAYKIRHIPTGLYLKSSRFGKRGKLYLKKPNFTQANVRVEADRGTYLEYFKDDPSITNHWSFTRPISEFEIEEYEIKKIEK